MRKLVLALVAVACAVPALAFAALPKKDSAFAYCETQNSCPLGFETSKTGRRIKELRMYNKCARVPVREGYPRIRVKDTGRFRKSGTVTDMVGAELTFTIKGRFRKPGKAVGTFEIDSVQRRRECNADPERFVAKRTGPAEEGL
jgi:hypothetical protein